MDTNRTRDRRKDTHQRLDMLLPYCTYHKLIKLSKSLNISRNYLLVKMIDSYAPDISENDPNKTLGN